MAAKRPQLGEVLFEFRRFGNVVRVAALDPLTNTEISMVGHAGYGEEMLKRVAARKLAYVIAKNRKKQAPR